MNRGSSTDDDYATFSGDKVAEWNVELSDRVYKIELEHGTISGKRVIIVDGVDVFRKNYMFKLVGAEAFKIGANHRAIVNIDAVTGFSYEYTLVVDGKPLEKFREAMKKNMKTWILLLDDTEIRICIEKDTMDVLVNGETKETFGEFQDNGTQTHFNIGENSCYVLTRSSGKKKLGMLYDLYINDTYINEQTP